MASNEVHEEPEVEDDVEDVEDAFGDAHASDDDDDYNAEAAMEESDDDEAADVLSPSKIALAKAEKARLRSLKKQQKDEIEKLREKQNASIAKVRSSNPQISDARAGVLPRKLPFPAPPRRGEAGTSRSFPAPAIAIDAAGFG
jgi:hypothetical protein